MSVSVGTRGSIRSFEGNTARAAVGFASVLEVSDDPRIDRVVTSIYRSEQPRHDDANAPSTATVISLESYRNQRGL